jgi:hypothetical protein
MVAHLLNASGAHVAPLLIGDPGGVSRPLRLSDDAGMTDSEALDDPGVIKPPIRRASALRAPPQIENNARLAASASRALRFWSRLNFRQCSETF